MRFMGMSPVRQLTRFPAVLLSLGALWPVGFAAGTSGGEGYKLGDEIPVSCLNRTMEGEHITDSLGKLEYIPFATCNETSGPFALHYGVSETITCTIPALTDSLYHLLEFYVHSDVPVTCRVPTAPLTGPGSSAAKEQNGESSEAGEGADSLAALSDNGPAFTPLTVALQGTLQLSHLHVWTDMNVLMHNMASDAAAQQPRPQRGQTGQPGFAVAGTAYSVPELETALQNKKLDEDDRAVALVQAAREPWTAGHGTKVVRGEPLAFTFHVAWVEGGASIGWPARSASESFLPVGKGSSAGSLFSKLVFFVLAASVGALFALYWERNGGRWSRGPVWHGDGILGVPSGRGKGSGVTFGNGGKINGYGGYSAATTSPAAGGGYFGYGGFAGGKKD